MQENRYISNDPGIEKSKRLTNKENRPLSPASKKSRFSFKAFLNISFTCMLVLIITSIICFLYMLWNVVHSVLFKDPDIIWILANFFIWLGYAVLVLFSIVSVFFGIYLYFSFFYENENSKTDLYITILVIFLISVSIFVSMNIMLGLSPMYNASKYNVLQTE
ncbi:hypothetical protein NECID01_2023 [Nematocida sp. AWRm77]|nr:hypothetical protein NECID01_2023 [Nematocida sp. AWRm77]